MVPENIHTPPHRRDWKFPGGGGGGGGVLKTQTFKAMYEAKLEFPEGWGVIGQIPSVGGYGYFLEPHIEPQRMYEFKLKVTHLVFLSD